MTAKSPLPAAVRTAYIRVGRAPTLSGPTERLVPGAPSYAATAATTTEWYDAIRGGIREENWGECADTGGDMRLVETRDKSMVWNHIGRSVLWRHVTWYDVTSRGMTSQHVVWNHIGRSVLWRHYSPVGMAEPGRVSDKSLRQITLDHEWPQNSFSTLSRMTWCHVAR